MFGIQDKGSTNSADFLEESPKWHLLSMVLEEINKNCTERGGVSGCGLEDSGSQEKVLIVTNDYRTSHQLTQVCLVEKEEREEGRVRARKEGRGGKSEREEGRMRGRRKGEVREGYIILYV